MGSLFGLVAMLGLVVSCGKFPTTSPGETPYGHNNPVAMCDRFSGPFGGGDGQETAPYLICSADHLLQLSRLSGRPVVVSLEADLDLAGIAVASVSDWVGTFDGNFHSIKNYRSQWPLFLTNRGVLRNVRFESINILGIEDEIGGVIISNAASGIVENVTVSGVVKSAYDRVGGVVGINWGEISRVSFHGTVESSQTAGGIAGRNSGSISRAAASAVVQADYDYVGGVVGEMTGGRIERSFSDSVLSGRSYLGGVVGWASAGQIENSYARGLVTAQNVAGGLVGSCSATIFFSYADVVVSGTTPGGLVGSLDGGSVVQSYWNTDRISISAAGTGRSRNELEQLESYKDWDFTMIWSLPAGELPQLR